MKKKERDAQTIDEYLALPADAVLRDARFVLERGEESTRRALAGTIMVLSGSVRNFQKIMRLSKKLLTKGRGTKL